MTMKQWSTTPANNASGVTSVNWAEGQLPSTVNDSARQMMADVRSWYEDAEWIDYGYSISYVSATVFKFHDANRKTLAATGRRVRAKVGAGTIYGTVADQTFSTSDTQVTVTWDSGTLDASLSGVALGILQASSDSLPRGVNMTFGRVGVGGTLSVSSVFAAGGAATFASTVGITGTLSAAAVVASGVVTFSSTVGIGATLSCSSAVVVGGALTVAGATTLSSVSVLAGLAAAGPASFSSVFASAGLQVAGPASFSTIFVSAGIDGGTY